MKKLIVSLALVLGAAMAVGQVTPVGPRVTPSYLGGILYASNFGQWQTAKANLGQWSWNNSSYCYASSGNTTFQSFTAGTPVTIIDTDNPAHDETVTPSVVTIVPASPSSNSSCAITITPAYPHTNYYFTSGTAGLQEVINWAGTAVYTVILTPDWALLGGTTGMITAALGNASVTISDQRTDAIVGYTWGGSAYAATWPTGGGGPSLPLSGGTMTGALNSSYIGLNSFSGTFQAATLCTDGGLICGGPLPTFPSMITVCASGCDYTDLQTALNSQIPISLGTLTVQLGDGVFPISTSILYNSPSDANILITGQNVYPTTVTSVASSSGSAGAYSIVLNVGSTSNITANVSYVAITGASGGTSPYQLDGYWPVTAVGSGTITITDTSTFATPPSGAVTATVDTLGSVLSCSVTCLNQFNHYVTNITNLGMVNSGGAPIGLSVEDAGRGFNGTPFPQPNVCGMLGFYGFTTTAFLGIYSGEMNCGTMVFGGNAAAITVDTNATLDATVVSVGNTYGALVEIGGKLKNESGSVYAGNGTSGTGTGIYLQTGAGAANPGATVFSGNSNGTIAVKALGKSYFSQVNATFLNQGAAPVTDIEMPDIGQVVQFLGPIQIPTRAAGDNSTYAATTASLQYQTAVPYWLQMLGTGADGAETCNGNLVGDKYYTTFSIPFGDTCTLTGPLTVHATGACSIAGAVVGTGLVSGAFNGFGGAPGGGGGGGAAAGVAGSPSYASVSGAGSAEVNGGTAGSSSGGKGGDATTIGTAQQRAIAVAAGQLDGQLCAGGVGGAGGSSGGARGNGGACFTLICASITGTDGSHTGTIDLSGANGTPAAANSTGSGGPGGGGSFFGSSQSAVGTWPTFISAPGAAPGGGTTTTVVPEAVGQGGLGVTIEPTVGLAVSSGALSGTCTVLNAGASSATGSNAPAGWSYIVLGGGGTLGTGTVNFVWSSGAVASCTITSGSSSGFTAATYTTSGTAGNAAPGLANEFSGW